MARTWSDKEEELANINMMIANTRGQGGSPGQLWDNPDRNPKPGEAVFGVEKGGQRFFEFLKAMGIDPANNIRKTGRPLANDDDWGEGNVPGHPDWKLSGISEFDSFMQNMRRGSQNPKSGSIKHHPPHIRKMILGIGGRLKAQAPANNIKSTWPWRTRRKDDPRYIREFYDPVTGMSMEDFKA